jgi:hypothetical protein
MAVLSLASSNSIGKSSDSPSSTTTANRERIVGIGSNKARYSLKEIGVAFLMIYSVLTSLYVLTSHSIMSFHTAQKQKLKQVQNQQQQQYIPRLRRQRHTALSKPKDSSSVNPMLSNTVFKAAVIQAFATDDAALKVNPTAAKSVKKDEDDEDDDILARKNDDFTNQQLPEAIKVIPPQPADIFDDTEDDKTEQKSRDEKDAAETRNSKNEFGLVTSNKTATVLSSEVVVVRDSATVTNSSRALMDEKILK